MPATAQSPAAGTDAAQAYKAAATEFLQLVVAGRIEEAYRKYVDMDGKHHNPFFPAGFPALQKAMMENHAQFPNKQITVKHVLAEGDLAIARSRLVLKPGGPEMVVVHMFRFRGDRVVELWDSGQELPADSPNKDGAF